MNNLLSYFGLVDARISASEKDVPVLNLTKVYFLNQLSQKNNSEFYHLALAMFIQEVDKPV